ncbi:MAG: dihydroorotase [Deltaproteobacteria bacterium]|nr:dihydroorotase [Deltaproteobacteria bacterium]MBW2360472.1 dihydroorotase [Deltaproteobacteria bacterium]
MSRLLIRGGRVLDPASERDEIADVLCVDGRIEAVGAELDGRGAEIFDAEGQWVAPGFVDLHCHLREPGQEYKEDIASGGRAAVAGGFTTVACMANTDPVNDDPATTDFILDRARNDSPARVYPVAAATKGLEGKVMTEMSALLNAGAVAFSDDGRTIMDSGVMRRVLEYSRLVDVPIIVHCEDRTLVGDGVLNEGAISTRLGLPGNPAIAEEVHVSRDIKLAELTGARLHVAHVSTAGGVEEVRRARERGISVTAEVTPHHLTLTDEAALGYDTSTKVAPPLRSAADVAACRAGLVDGSIDAIATDHAPHAQHEKEQQFTEAPHGMLGFETAAAVSLDLVRRAELSPLEWVRRLSLNPARILRRPGGSLVPGEPADVVVIDPEKRWVYDTAKGHSKSRNSPWAGQELTGRVTATFVEGKLVFHVDRGVLAP